jgi:hypothetical protein
MSVGRPATAGCSQEELIGGDGVSKRVSGDCTLAEAGGQPDCGHVQPAMARSSRCPPGDPGLGARADERLWRGGLLPPPIGSTDDCGAGGSEGIGSGSRASALAGRAGLCSAGSLPAGLIGSHVAAVESASRIQRTHPVSKV